MWPDGPSKWTIPARTTEDISQIKCLRGEWGEPVGDVRVRLDAGVGSVPGVDQVEGFAPAAVREELAVAGGGPPPCPRRPPSVARPGPRRPQGPLRADRRAGRRAEPVPRAVSEQDEVRRRAGRGRVADAVGVAGLPRTLRGGCAAACRPMHRSTSHQRRCSRSSATTA